MRDQPRATSVAVVGSVLWAAATVGNAWAIGFVTDRVIEPAFVARSVTAVGLWLIFGVLVAILLLALGLWQLLRTRRTVQGAIALACGILVGVFWMLTETIPGDVTAFAPHLTTLLVLALASQRLRMPAANGKVYRRGDGH